MLNITAAFIRSFDLSQTTTPLDHRWKLPFSAVGLVALSECPVVERRAALTGTSALLDILVLAPSLHRQQSAPQLNLGEYPACGALTTGYVFRVENEATVAYLQRIGRTGHLTTLRVSNLEHGSGLLQRIPGHLYDYRGATLIDTLAYVSALGLTLIVVFFIYRLQDWNALTFIGILVFIRAVNVLVMRQRAVPGWFGAKEPGVKSDLLVLMSKDRWIRLQGLTDDIKAVTSGAWLKDMSEFSMFQRALVSSGSLLAALNIGFAASAQRGSQILLAILLYGSAGLLGLANESTGSLQMHGRLIVPTGKCTAYNRRLDLAKQLIEETTDDKDSLIFGRKDALKGALIRMGVIQPDQASNFDKRIDGEGATTM